jgi:methyl-accepting chemotaxis protein
MTTNDTPFPGPEGAGHDERSKVALSTPPIFLFDGRLCVTDFDTGEPAVVALFEAEADQSSYPALLESILKVGAVALARAGSQVDLGHVAAEVERLSQAVGHSVESFSKVLSVEADAQVKALSSKVEEVLGDDGALVRMLDPADPRGAAAKLTQALTETAEASGRHLVRLLDPSCPEGPMAAFAGELRALSNSVGQLAIQVAATSAAERAASAEAARGTRKGGLYEDQVVEVLGEIARTSGDVAEAVGATTAWTARKREMSRCTSPPQCRRRKGEPYLRGQEPQTGT